jgi:TetR/AcrR family transcriptional regulator
MISSDSSSELLVKGAIQKAAIGLFSERGMDGVSVREIAEQAKVSPAMISYYFESKENLYLTCIDSFARGKLQFVKEILSAVETREEFSLRLKMFIQTMTSNYSTDNQMTLIILRELQTKRDNKEYFERIFAAMQPLNSMIHDFFEEARRRRFIKSGMDTHLLVSALMGLLIHPHQCLEIAKKMSGCDFKKPALQKEYAELVTNLFLSGVLS